MNIFVSVAAFCDPLLRFTIDDLFVKAQYPENIRVAIVDQSLDDNRSWLDTLSYRKHIRYVKIDPIDSKGVSWARNIAFSLYDGESFLLQIDSHTYFNQHWDSTLTGLIEQLLNRTDKPVLSTYPPAFTFDDKNQPQRKGAPSPQYMVLRPKPESQLTNDNATLRFNVQFVPAADFVEGCHVAAGFLFTLGSFVEEIPYDPFLYFHGEEQSLAIRAFTRGWSIYHPRHCDIPLYHLYKQAGEGHFSHHWHPNYEKKRLIKWIELKKRSDTRLSRLLLEQNIKGVYGLGQVRTLQDFAKISGIDYLNRTLQIDMPTAAEV